MNLGSGTLRLENFVNVDNNPLMKADENVDLNVFPWPWQDNTYSHIIAKDILEYLGDKPSDIINVIKEMYRVSENGAIWEIQVANHNSEKSNNPEHKRKIYPDMFNMFNKKTIFERIEKDDCTSALAYEHDIDIEICDVKYDFSKAVEDRLKNNNMTQEELNYAINHLSNAATATKILIQVHKPGRYDKHEYIDLINRKSEKYGQIS